MNIAQLSLKNIEQFGEYPFLTYNNETVTNVQLDEKVNRFAHYLVENDVRENDRVIVILPNLPDVLISYQAILKIGAIVVPTNVSLSIDNLQHIVENSEPKFIITDSTNEQKVKQAVKNTSLYPNFYIVDLEEGDLSQLEKKSFPVVTKDKEDVAAIVYTSGTTGTPKGAMITHDNLRCVEMELQALGILDEYGRVRPEERVRMLVSLPISHIYGLTVTMMSYRAGTEIYLMNRFDLEETFTLIDRHKITLFAGVPTMYYWMAQVPEAKHFDFSSVKHWISGADSLSASIREQFEQTFNTKVIEGYGLTESTASFALQRPNEQIKVNSVGRVVPQAKVKVLDDDGNKLPTGEIGELAIKGRNVMKGYYKLETETREVLQDGWLLTGDVGYIDEDGHIFIVERKNDLIIRGGFNIYPQEIENVLMTHPAVLEAGVVGKPNVDLGEVVSAFVTLKEDASVTEAELMSFSEKHLAKFKVPEHINFVEELPKNDLGKVLRRQLKEKFKEELR